ncbi:MAG: hypothetical protein ACYS9X_26425, partial [Planctomycetota bacterium]
ESGGQYHAHATNLGTTDVGDSGDVDEVMAWLEKYLEDGDDDTDADDRPAPAPPANVRPARASSLSSSGGGSWGGGSYGGRTPNDDRSDSLNPNNAAYRASMDNRSNQMNPNNPAYHSSRRGK